MSLQLGKQGAQQAPSAQLGGGGGPKKKSWTARRYLYPGLAITLGLFLGVGVWSAYAQIAGAVIASAELRVQNKRQTVKHLEGGVVKEIMVRDGEFVTAGDILMRLDSTSVASNLEIVESQLDELMARRVRLEAESLETGSMEPGEDVQERAARRPQADRMLQGQMSLFDARRQTLKQQLQQLEGRIGQTKDEIIGGEVQISALDRQLELIREELTLNRSLLKRGLIEKSRVTALDREEARLDGQRGALVSQIAQSRGRISEVEIRMLELRSTRREEAITQLRDMTAQIAELSERRTSLAESLSRMEIRAPDNGIVLDMTVNTVGGVVSPAEPLLYLVPTEAPLVVEARIETFARDEVYSDQPATVLFPGFNQRTTPELIGKVGKVGADRLEDQRTGMPYYVVEIDVPEAEWKRLREAIGTELAPGMPAEAHIQTGERSAASYFLKPLMDNFRRAWIEA
ncbi:MAG: HlyD family type I secretion periplasmic adaptor subunit [Rhodobacteraceae bacterium]|nr:HlyD family type I secretion periplasmic adaptor subunit [Paracoccaceae bacterium]